MSKENPKNEMVGMVRIKDADMWLRICHLMEEHGLSFNMAVQMLIGFAFNEIDRQGKTFKSTVVFESE